MSISVLHETILSHPLVVRAVACGMSLICFSLTAIFIEGTIDYQSSGAQGPRAKIVFGLAMASIPTRKHWVASWPAARASRREAAFFTAAQLQ
jgi:hypothetical protein